jgi:hypothetical protein
MVVGGAINLMRTPSTTPRDPSPRAATSAEYQALQKYLTARYADTVVLKFTEIEDLLGFPLPALARHQHEWWATAASGTPASPQSRSWVQANRSAIANFPAQTVMFERAGG